MCNPKTSISGDDLFESEAGFKDVLTGFYLKMGQTNLYAENLTYGYLEMVSEIMIFILTCIRGKIYMITTKHGYP